MARLVRDEADLIRAVEDGVDIHLSGRVVATKPIALRDCAVYYSFFDTLESSIPGLISFTNVTAFYLNDAKPFVTEHATW